MAEYAHGFVMHASRCDGCLACMRVCPTRAIRVRRGKALVRQELCIDCGSCLTACPRGVFSATTRRLEDFEGYAFRVAIPSPVLYGQFPLDVTPEHIAQGLLAVGFDAVWDYGVDTALVARAIVDFVDSWEGPRPVISIACAAVVRLMQVAYPRMLDQAIRVRPPREVAGREVKRAYSAELGLPPERIAAIYVTPCQARTVSILQPAEGGASHLDGAIGIPQLYNSVLTAAREAAECESVPDTEHPVRSSIMLRWSTRRPLAQLLKHRRYLAVTGLPNVIRVFDDIEKGKLRDIDFLEANSCWGGCCNGNLTVDNVYVSQAKLQHLMADLPDSDPTTEAEIARRYPAEDVLIRRPFLPREHVVVGDLRERVRRHKEAERIAALLPGYDCGLCGAPGCDVLARDVAAGEASREDCVFECGARLDRLRRARRGEGVEPA